MWEGSVFLLIQSQEYEILEVKKILEDLGSKVIIKYEYENDINFLDDLDNETGVSSGSKKSGLITHIITNTIEFIEYDLARSAMIPITSDKWVHESAQAGRFLNPKLYNPDPKLFMKDCFVCVADNLPVGDKEVIYGAVRAFGGSYLDALTKYTTHLIAVDFTNEKSIIAYTAINNATGDDKVDIKIVLPHWIDHCLTVGRKLDETPYLLSDPKILQSGGSHSITPDLNVLISHEDLPESTQFNSKFFEGKTFFIAPDYNLSERLNSSIKALIENHGGVVSNSFNVKKIDVYIGKYRNGDAYVQSCKSKRIIVGNINWLYAIIVTDKWILPKNSNLLHYPVPPLPLSSFKDLKICVTNYSGDARSYLSKLILTLGGTFTKTMTKENHYLVAAKSEGKKYDTAKNKWLDENGHPKVKIVNHLWLEACFAKWDLLDDNDQKFKFLGNGTDGVEVLLGRTSLEEAVVSKWSEPTSVGENSEVVDIDDSMSENETQSNRELTKAKAIAKNSTKNIDPESTTSSKHSSVLSPGADADETNETTEDPDTSGLIEVTHRYGGRSAAKKAALKLHSNMSDLNQYQEMSKSSRKMKTYMEELENSISATAPKKRASTPVESSEPEQNKKLKKSKKSSEETKVDVSSEFDIVAIITGCESELTLTKSDLAKLSSIGIKVLSELSNKFAINTLIAPKILRTEKFLRSLSKVNRIIHPNYLVELLKKLNSSDEISASKESITLEFNIDHYSLDKYIPIKEINNELGISKSSNTNGLAQLLNSENHGKLFSGLKINLSTNLNGGTDVITRILKDNGLLESQAINPSLTGVGLEKVLLKSDLDSEQIILVAHNSKDSKLIKSFNKFLKDTKSKGKVIEWDWCVKSIFKMELEPFENFAIKA